MTPAVRFLEQLAVPHQLLDYTSAATHNRGIAAASALGLPEAQVFKTLIAQLDDGALVTAVIPVAEQLNLKLLSKAAAAKSARMAETAASQRSTGYVIGGISPFGQKKTIPVFLAAQALAFEQIYVSGGKRGLEIAVAPQDLVRCCHARVCKLCREA
jgi:Cys-tRNA(Pro)/Cys-tRNA(Cys) deacylase